MRTPKKGSYSIGILVTIFSIQCGFLEDVFQEIIEDDETDFNNFEVETTFITVPNAFLPRFGLTPSIPLLFQPRSIVGPTFFPPVFPSLSSVQVVPSATPFGFRDPFDPFLFASLDPLSSEFGGSLMTTPIGTIQFQELIETAQQQAGASIFPSVSTRLNSQQSVFFMLENEQRFVTELQPDFRSSIAGISPSIQTVSTGPGFELQFAPTTFSTSGTSFQTTISPSTGVLFNTSSVSINSVGTSIASDRLLLRSASVQTTTTLKQDEALLLGGFRQGGKTTAGVLTAFGNVPVSNRGVDQRIVGDDDILLVLIRLKAGSINVE